MAVALATAALGGLASPGTAFAGHEDDAFRQVNLVSDLPGVAQILDNEVKNPWGIALGPTTPLWVNNNFNPALATLCETCFPTADQLLTKITLYRGANGHDPITKVPLEVTASLPTGMVFNPTGAFQVTQGGVTAPARFLFAETYLNAAGDDAVGQVTGWSSASSPLPTATARTAATKDGAFPNGLALVPAEGDEGGPRLLVVSDTIDVYDADFNRVDSPDAFVDPGLPADLAPYNVAFLKGRVYVTYGSESSGAISVFTREGRFIKRLVTGAPLVDPWGMTIAPDSWGELGGALLVGNVDDGRINAFNRRNGHLLGTVSDAHGDPLVNPGLWGLAFGNGVIGTPDTLLFAAGIGSEPGGFGPDGYSHGLVGLIEHFER